MPDFSAIFIPPNNETETSSGHVAAVLCSRRRGVYRAIKHLFTLVLCSLILLNLASAHNLDQQADFIGFDDATLARMQQRQAAGQALIQTGDVVGLIVKASPTVGTPTGAGGYTTFFVPVGTQVVGAHYERLDSTGKFLAMAMKGQSLAALGDGA